MEVYIMDSITKNISTKAFAEGDAVQTELTLDFSGCTVEDVYEIAAQAAVVKWQGTARKAKTIPSVATYKVPKPGTRSVGDPITILIAKFGIEGAIEELKRRMQPTRTEE
jgi:hypothetical protein